MVTLRMKGKWLKELKKKMWERDYLTRIVALQSKFIFCTDFLPLVPTVE